MGVGEYRPTTVRGAVVAAVIVVSLVIAVMATQLITIVVGVLLVAIIAFLAYGIGVRAWRRLSGGG